MISLFRKQLDEQINQIRPVSFVNRPSKGWIYSIRRALGLTTKQLAQRLNISQQSVSKLEHSEASFNITMSALENVASSLNCRLIYMLIPENPIEEIVALQMDKKASEILSKIHHSMGLEDQSTNREALMQAKLDLITSFKQKKNISFIWD